jgi:hypothetical protein
MKKNHLFVTPFIKRGLALFALANLYFFSISCSKEEIISDEIQTEAFNNNTSKPESLRVNAVKWTADPNLVYTDSFYRLSVESGEPASVTTENDATYGKVWKVNKPSGSKRAELSQTDPSTGNRAAYVPAEGDKVYIGWRVKMNIVGSTNPSSGMAIFQNKSQGTTTQNYPFLFGWNGSTITMSTYVPGSGSQASRGTQRWSRAYGENSWLTIVVGVKFSKNSSTGTLELWVNGTKQDLVGDDASKVLTHRTLDDNGNYFKWGAYNEAARDFNVTAYLANMKVATTYDEARP